MEFRVLGPVGVWNRDAEVPLDGAKQRTVLAALLLSGGRALPDSRLCELLWGEHPPATYPAQIYNYVSRLRKYLGPDVDIRRQWSGYVIHTRDGQLDLAEFERLAARGREAQEKHRYEEAADAFHAALALWRGPALMNVTEFLARAETHRLAEMRMAVLERRVETDLLLGRYAQLVPELTRLVGEYPLHEKLRCQLMTALFRTERQADALAVYHEGRRVLADELGVEPGPTLSATFRAILTAQPARTGGPNAVAASWQGVRPAMLPPAIGDFTGRTAELGAVAEVLTGDHASAAQVTGMAGVGKTALALYAAHRERDRFPDGQLYADLGGNRGNAVEPREVLGWFLRSLGNAEAAIPRGLDERVRLYRSHLAGRRMLVVLDDAADDAQVRPLLPGEAGCRVLVTSRVNLADLPGAAVVEVGTLTTAEAVDLLAAVVGRHRVSSEPAAARRIVRLCGWLSLGIRVAGSRLLARPHWSLAYFAERLADEQYRLDELRLGTLDVRARLDGSYVALASQSQLALRRLALLEVPDFASWATAAVLGVPRRTGDEVTENLVDARLLEVAGSDGGRRQRHRFHDLVRVFAREKADHVDRMAVAATRVLSTVS